MQVYKTHLVEGRAPAGPAVDSARANLAATYVNAFVNAGFGTDKLVTPETVSAMSNTDGPFHALWPATHFEARPHSSGAGAHMGPYLSVTLLSLKGCS